jgi:hypothetical protein
MTRGCGRIARLTVVKTTLVSIADARNPKPGRLVAARDGVEEPVLVRGRRILQGFTG